MYRSVKFVIYLMFIGIISVIVPVSVGTAEEDSEAIVLDLEQQEQQKVLYYATHYNVEK